MRRRLVLALVLFCAAMTDNCGRSVRLRDHVAEPIRFIHPKTHMSLGGMSGVDVPVQIWMERSPDNRQVIVAWDGPGCYGSSMKTLDGQYEAAIYPSMRYLMVRMGPGVCTITALLIGQGGEVRHRATFEFTVCGGSLEGGCDP